MTVIRDTSELDPRPNDPASVRSADVSSVPLSVFRAVSSDGECPATIMILYPAFRRVSTAFVNEGINTDPKDVWIMSAISLRNSTLGAVLSLVVVVPLSGALGGFASSSAVQNCSNFSLSDAVGDTDPWRPCRALDANSLEST